MNHITISGIVVGDIIQELNRETYTCKFKIKNIYFSPTKKNNETTYIRCIAYGSLGRYCYNELYEGANIIVTGRILNRCYIPDNKSTAINILYIGCNTVSKLDQLDYE